MLVGSAIAVPLLLRNGVLSELEGGLLIGCAVVFTIVTLTVSARLDPDARSPTTSPIRRIVVGIDARAPQHRRGERRACIGGRGAAARRRAATSRAIA